MFRSNFARLRAFTFVAVAAATLAACSGTQQTGTGLAADAACAGKPGMLDFRVGGRATMLPPAPARGCATPTTLAMAERG